MHPTLNQAVLEIERHVAAAGFRDVVVARHTREFDVADPEAEWRQRLADPSGAAELILAALSPEEGQLLHDEVIATLEGYRRDGEIRLPSEAVVVTATR